MKEKGTRSSFSIVIKFILFNVYFLSPPCGIWDLNSSAEWLNPYRLHGTWGILTTGPPGKSPVTILYQSCPELTNPNFPGEILFSVMKISFLHVNFHTKKAQGKGRGIAFASLEQERLRRRGITGIPWSSWPGDCVTFFDSDFKAWSTLPPGMESVLVSATVGIPSTHLQPGPA